MGGLTNTGTVICKISRIALDVGVMFETMTNRDNLMQMKRSFLQFTVQYQFLEKNVMLIKWVISKSRVSQTVTKC